MLVQMTGIEAPKACSECRRGQGPFDSCVVMDARTGAATQALFKSGFAGCANCLGSSPSSCSLKERKFELGRIGWLSPLNSDKHIAAHGSKPRDTSAMAGNGALRPSTSDSATSTDPALNVATITARKSQRKAPPTVQSRFDVIQAYFPHSRMTATEKDWVLWCLRMHPQQRRPEWYPGKIYSRPPFGPAESTFKHVQSLVLYTEGLESTNWCMACKETGGLYAKCVLGKIQEGDQPIQCSNCIFHGRPCVGFDVHPPGKGSLPGPLDLSVATSTPISEDDDADENLGQQSRHFEQSSRGVSGNRPQTTENLAKHPARQSAVVPAPFTELRKVREAIAESIEGSFHGPPDDMDMLEGWELAAPDTTSSNQAPKRSAQAFTARQMEKALEVTSNVSVSYVTIKPGTTFKLDPKTAVARLCVVTQGKVRLRSQGQEEIVVGFQGAVKIAEGAACAVQNRAYVDAMLCVTEIRE
jgi:hypothetical protein